MTDPFLKKTQQLAKAFFTLKSCKERQTIFVVHSLSQRSIWMLWKVTAVLKYASKLLYSCFFFSSSKPRLFRYGKHILKKCPFGGSGRGDILDIQIQTELKDSVFSGWSRWGVNSIWKKNTSPILTKIQHFPFFNESVPYRTVYIFIAQILLLGYT